VRVIRAINYTQCKTVHKSTAQESCKFEIPPSSIRLAFFILLSPFPIYMWGVQCSKLFTFYPANKHKYAKSCRDMNKLYIFQRALFYLASFSCDTRGVRRTTSQTSAPFFQFNLLIAAVSYSPRNSFAHSRLIICIFFNGNATTQ
jgi:hypothetical protein